MYVLQKERRDALLKYADLIQQHRAQIHWLEAILVGKDATFAKFEADFAVEIFTCTHSCVFKLFRYPSIDRAYRLRDYDRQVLKRHRGCYR